MPKTTNTVRLEQKLSNKNVESYAAANNTMSTSTTAGHGQENDLAEMNAKPPPLAGLPPPPNNKNNNAAAVESIEGKKVECHDDGCIKKKKRAKKNKTDKNCRPG